MTGSWHGYSGVPEEDRFLSCFTLMLAFVTQHRTGSHHCSKHVRARHCITNVCHSIRRMSRRALRPLLYRPVGGQTLSRCYSSLMLDEENQSRSLNVLICAALPSCGHCRPLLLPAAAPTQLPTAGTALGSSAAGRVLHIQSRQRCPSRLFPLFFSAAELHKLWWEPPTDPPDGVKN